VRQRRRRAVRQQPVRIVLDDHGAAARGDGGDLAPALLRHGQRGRVLQRGIEIDEACVVLAACPFQQVGPHARIVHVDRNNAPAQLPGRRAQPRIHRRFGDDDVARPGQAEDQRRQRRLRAWAHHDMFRRHRAEHRRQPARARRPRALAAAAQVIRHQQVAVGAHQHQRQPLFQHVVEIDALRRRRNVHAQVQHLRQLDFGRRGVGAARAAPFQQVAALRFVICARHRRQVDLQQGGKLALRRQAFARAQASVRQRALDEIGDLDVARPGVQHEVADPGRRPAVILYGY
jgi:hypothetical protein